MSEETATKESVRSREIGKDVQKLLDSAVTLSGDDKSVLIEELVKGMTALELSSLVESLSATFGVSAAAPMMAFAPGTGGGGGEVQEVAKTDFNVVLKSCGDKKIQVIKEVRAITGLGLKEAKALVDSAPKVVKEGVPQEEANKLKEQLEAAGATVDLE